MPKTLATGKLQEGRSKEDENFALVNQLHDLASAVYQAGPFLLSTSTAADGTIWTSKDAMPGGSIWSVTAHVQGQSPLAQCRFLLEALFFRRVGGAATQESGTTAVVTKRTDANFSSAFLLVGDVLTLTVTDAAARNVSWAAWIQIRQSA